MNAKNQPLPHLIALANEPRMVREMLHQALSVLPGIIVVEQTGDLTQLSELFQQVQIDWLVVTLGDDRKLPRPVQTLFSRIPVLSVMALSGDGSRVEIRRKTAKRGVLEYVLEDVSLAEVITLLRNKHGEPKLPTQLM